MEFAPVSEDDLRAAAAAPVGAPDGDQSARLEAASRDAAVLIPVQRRETGLHVILTMRPRGLRDHPGQIAFPGGKVDAADDGPLAAALRESHEEIGLPYGAAQVLGRIEPYATITGFAVSPFVALVDPGFKPVPEAGEVEEVFAPPLDFLMNPANHQKQTLTHGGRSRSFWAMPWEGYYIWGATAGMLRRLAQRVAEARA